MSMPWCQLNTDRGATWRTLVVRRTLPSAVRSVLAPFERDSVINPRFMHRGYSSDAWPERVSVCGYKLRCDSLFAKSGAANGVAPAHCLLRHNKASSNTWWLKNTGSEQK